MDILDSGSFFLFFHFGGHHGRGYHENKKYNSKNEIKFLTWRKQHRCEVLKGVHRPGPTCTWTHWSYCSGFWHFPWLIREGGAEMSTIDKSKAKNATVFAILSKKVPKQVQFCLLLACWCFLASCHLCRLPLCTGFLKMLSTCQRNYCSCLTFAECPSQWS